jgi:hypothetical protein
VGSGEMVIVFEKVGFEKWKNLSGSGILANIRRENDLWY